MTKIHEMKENNEATNKKSTRKKRSNKVSIENSNPSEENIWEDGWKDWNTK